MIDTVAGGLKEKGNPKANLFFGPPGPWLLARKKPMHFDLDSSQYEFLEVKDSVFAHDFCKEHLLVEDEEGKIKDRYSESELRTLGWPVAVSGEFQDMPFAMLRPIKNQMFNGHI